MLEQSPPDPNFWIVAGIIAGSFLLWLAADFLIGIFIGKIIHVGNPSDEGE